MWGERVRREKVAPPGDPIKVTITHLEELDRHWLKPDSELKVWQGLERDLAPLLVQTEGREHLWGCYLTDKINAGREEKTSRLLSFAGII
ncbi:MAG: hypothetical protein ACOZF2_04225 [Thermodesulfobacteriota bacterium]